MAYTLNMDVIIYDVYSTFTPDITNMWILSKWLKILWLKCKILRDMFRRHTGIGYRFVERRKKIENYSEF
jgi:hypothetical protein